MNIFVTVGHTHYDSLFRSIDQYLSPEQYLVTNQIADGAYSPKQHEFFRFVDSTSELIDQADIVVTHAGAGSVFNLLEAGKKVVVVPNFERVDKHQEDLASFVENNKYGCVCWDLSQIEKCIVTAKTNDFNMYKRTPFSGYSTIEKLVNNKSLMPKISQKSFSKNIEIIADIPVRLFIDMEEAVAAVISNAGHVNAGSAIAVNPEKIVTSIRQPEVKKILLSASFCFADGIGVVKTLARKSRRSVARIPGCELWEELMVKAGEIQIPVFLVGAKPEVIEETERKLIAKYGTPIVGIADGYFAGKEDELIERIVSLQPQIVSVALGSPRQELFINRCREVCPETFFIGVGGTYDVFIGHVKRAPRIFRRANLEWLYRLACQPTRFSRQLNLIKYLYLDFLRRL